MSSDTKYLVFSNLSQFSNTSLVSNNLFLTSPQSCWGSHRLRAQSPGGPAADAPCKWRVQAAHLSTADYLGASTPHLRFSNWLEWLTEGRKHFTYVGWFLIKDTTQTQVNGRDALGKVWGRRTEFPCLPRHTSVQHAGAFSNSKLPKSPSSRVSHPICSSLPFPLPGDGEVGLKVPAL